MLAQVEGAGGSMLRRQLIGLIKNLLINDWLLDG